MSGTEVQVGPYVITGRSFRAPRRTFVLSRIEATRIRRPGLIMALGLMAASYGFCWTFERLLYDHELALLLVVPPVVALIASRIAVLSIQYFGQRDTAGTVIGSVRHLGIVRDSIDAVLEERADADLVHRDRAEF